MITITIKHFSTMKILKNIVFIFLTALSTQTLASDCANCESFGVIKTSQNSANNINLTSIGKISSKDRFNLILDYCMKFSQIPQEMVGSMIKEMEKTPIPPEEFFTDPICQPAFYSSSIKSPMLHLIVDDITKREEFFRNIWLYYSKKRKQPELFSQIIKAKNTRNETLLDYMEIIRLRNGYTFDTQISAMNKIIKILCENGASYSAIKDKECPKQ